MSEQGTMQTGPFLLTLFVSATLGGACSAGEGPMRATIDRPAVVAVPARPPGGAASAGTRPRLVVTVVGYTPSTDGPVTAVVALRCGGEEKEVGRFGVFPDRPFTPAQPDRAQRYGFALPACTGPALAVVSLEPVIGSGRGAGLDVGEVTLE